MTYSYPASTEQYPRSRARTSGALIAADIIALLGIIVGCVSLFVHGWINAKLTFAPRAGNGASILQPLGVDINAELTRIADREIAATISPTMWAYKGHAFQILFALLVLAGVLLLIGLAAPRLRIALNALALLSSVGAVVVMVVALVHLRDQTSGLPARVAQAVVNSPVAGRVFSLTTGKPQLTTSPGWPIYAVMAGLVLALLGTLFALIAAAARSSRGAAAR